MSRAFCWDFQATSLRLDAVVVEAEAAAEVAAVVVAAEEACRAEAVVVEACRAAVAEVAFRLAAGE